MLSFLVEPEPRGTRLACWIRAEGDLYKVRASIRRPLTSGAVALGGVLAVVAGLAIMDERVRGQIAELANRRTLSGEVSSSLGYLRDVILVVFEAIHERSIDQAPQMIFSVAAVALVLLLVRTRI